MKFLPLSDLFLVSALTGAIVLVELALFLCGHDLIHAKLSTT